jgi:uracil-DNA glycosylase
MDFYKELPEAWLNILDHNIISRTQEKLNKALASDTPPIFPKQSDIFKIFRLLDPDRIRVLILGQDAYYANENQANGIAFDVNKGVKIPPSLRNIHKEVRRNYPDASLDLTSWVTQGVFMLNAFLTVVQNKPCSHQMIWEEFTDHVIQVVSRQSSRIVFVLWGKFAEKKASLIDKKNVLLITSHPSPLSCYKTNAPFDGSDIFLKINNELNTTIKW